MSLQSLFMQPVDQSERPIPAECRSGGASHGNGPLVSILLAEDNPVNQRLVKALVSLAGYACDVVDCGRAAVEAAATKHYDMILMDIRMPEMSGLEATRHIRASGGWGAEVPIIAMTASVCGDTAEACHRAGMSDFITKPINRIAFLDRLAQYARIALGQ